jgi:hypothetical protein
LAEILLPVAAEVAMVARRRISRYNSLSCAKMENTFAYGNHISRHLMAEQCRGSDHFGMITAPKNFYVGTAR